MRLNKIYLDEALNKLNEVRAKNTKIEANRRTEVMNKLPQYAELEQQLMHTMGQIMNLALDKSRDAVAKIDRVIDNIKQIRGQMDELLEKNGYPADYLDPIYNCKKCRDTGNTGNEWCECLCRISNEIAAAELNENAPLSRSRFDNFDLSRYPKTADDGDDASPFEIMNDNLAFCKNYADNFSEKGNGILMLGATGLGKTHLSLAIANEVLKKGFCVIYGSLPTLIKKIQNEQFNRAEGDTMTLVTSADLLILDDLGAENNTDWAVSALYEIINTRQNHGLQMIINTNLTAYELKERYQDRLFSRMFSMKVLFFSGNDNRMELS